MILSVSIFVIILGFVLELLYEHDFDNQIIVCFWDRIEL